MGDPIPGARPSPARPSGAVLASAPFLPGDPVCCPWAWGASPLLPQHRWPNTLRTDTCCCCLPVPPGPGAEAAAPSPASCAPCLPPQACTSLSPMLTSMSLCILCPILTSTSLHTPEPCARLPVPVPTPTHSKGSARSRERWGLCRIPRICILGIGDRPRVCSQPSGAQPCLPPRRGWSTAPPSLWQQCQETRPRCGGRQPTSTFPALLLTPTSASALPAPHGAGGPGCRGLVRCQDGTECSRLQGRFCLSPANYMSQDAPYGGRVPGSKCRATSQA